MKIRFDSRSLTTLALFLSLSTCGAAVRAQVAQLQTPGEVTDAAPVAPGQVHVVTVQFKSSLVGKVLPYNVILPVDYDRSTSRYPVLYLLHGLGGHYSDWVTNTNIADYAAAYRMIIVMPEGNNNWYTDSATDPSDKYESTILQELIPDVDSRFRTIAFRRCRSIAGLSMGGYGALKFAVKRPDLFAFAASLSGALDVAALSGPPKPGEWPLIHESIMAAFGPSGSDTRKANDLFSLFRSVPQAKLADLPYLYLDCGTEDGLIKTARAMDDLLLARKIPHDFRERPGIHDWAEWDAQIPGVLALAAQKMPVYAGN